MSYYRISRRQAFHFAVSFLAAICAMMVYLPKRMFLVDMTKVHGGPDFYPWYYLPVSCDYMTPWKDVYTGSQFCWGLNLLPVILFPFGLACLLTWIWETVHPENRKKPMNMGEKLATVSAPAKKTGAKKTVTTTAAPKKTAGLKKVAAKAATKKTGVKKPAAKKTTAKKRTAKSTSRNK